MNDTGTPSRNSNLFSVLKYAGIATGIVGGAFFLFRIMDVVLLWSFYSSIFEKVQRLGGFEDSVTGMIAVFVTAVLMLVFPVAIGALLTGNRKKLLLVAGVAALWFLGMFIISRPRDGEYFNKVTGTPQYKYCIAKNGKIILRNMGYNFDPQTGQKLELFTTEIAQKYPRVTGVESESPPQPVSTPKPIPIPTTTAYLPSTPTPTAAPSTANLEERVVMLTRVPPPKPKSRIEVAQEAPICEDAIDIKLDLGSSPRRDIAIQTGCWSGWIEFDLSTIVLFSRISNTSQSRYGAVGGKDLLYLLSDDRIVTAEKIKTTKLIVPKYRLMGEGIARAAIGRSEEEFKEIIETPILNGNN